MHKCIVLTIVVFRSAVASCAHSQHSAVASCAHSQHSAVASCTHSQHSAIASCAHIQHSAVASCAHSQHSAVASCAHSQYSAATLRTIIYLQFNVHTIAPVSVCDNFALLFPTADPKQNAPRHYTTQHVHYSYQYM
jgi:hypothetical protein